MVDDFKHLWLRSDLEMSQPLQSAHRQGISRFTWTHAEHTRIGESLFIGVVADLHASQVREAPDVRSHPEPPLPVFEGAVHHPRRQTLARVPVLEIQVARLSDIESGVILSRHKTCRRAPWSIDRRSVRQPDQPCFAISPLAEGTTSGLAVPSQRLSGRTATQRNTS